MSTPDRLAFDGMTWPNPDDPREIEWKLRYGVPTRSELNAAAEMVAAYKQLVYLPQRSRNARVSGIRKARDAAEVKP